MNGSEAVSFQSDGRINGQTHFICLNKRAYLDINNKDASSVWPVSDIGPCEYGKRRVERRDVLGQRDVRCLYTNAGLGPALMDMEESEEEYSEDPRSTASLNESLSSRQKIAPRMTQHNGAFDERTQQP